MREVAAAAGGVHRRRSWRASARSAGRPSASSISDSISRWPPASLVILAGGAGLAWSLGFLSITIDLGALWRGARHRGDRPRAVAGPDHRHVGRAADDGAGVVVVGRSARQRLDRSHRESRAATMTAPWGCGRFSNGSAASGNCCRCCAASIPSPSAATSSRSSAAAPSSSICSARGAAERPRRGAQRRQRRSDRLLPARRPTRSTTWSAALERLAADHAARGRDCYLQVRDERFNPLRAAWRARGGDARRLPRRARGDADLSQSHRLQRPVPPERLGRIQRAARAATIGRKIVDRALLTAAVAGRCRRRASRMRARAVRSRARTKRAPAISSISIRRTRRSARTANFRGYTGRGFSRRRSGALAARS